MPTQREYDNWFLAAAGLCESGWNQAVMDFDDLEHPGSCRWEPMDIELQGVIRRAGELLGERLTARDWDRVHSGEHRVENNLRWAYKHLQDQKMVIRIGRGRFQLTADGRDRAAYLNRHQYR